MVQLRDSLAHFSEPVRAWFASELGEPTLAQARGWPEIAAGRSTLLLAPTGSGKTLAAFLASLDRLMFQQPGCGKGVRAVYVSPLKALGSDVEKNLLAPVRGIVEHASALGVDCYQPSIAQRTGDTPASRRARLRRSPPDILITTPESLYLMLTSQVRETLRQVETVIIDEIHSLVSTKRGAHLALSLERLEQLRSTDKPLQRIGLSATQRPLDEVAEFLVGFDVELPTRAPNGAPVAPQAGADTASQRLARRAVSVVDAGHKKQLLLSVEMPSAERSQALVMPAVSQALEKSPAEASSVWAAIYPRLFELIQEHRSTMIFVNNRGLSERLVGALNELAGAELCLAHHGSVSKERRYHIEDQLKRGNLRAIVATSSLELGIDVGAVDLVVQIEAPASIASAVQRVGRAGHQVGAVSKGVIFPKYRADLLACAAAVERMYQGKVELSRYLKNPLDVLAQQLVAMCSMDALSVDQVFASVRRAAPFAELSFSVFCSVLDMLAGKYASDEFSELKARLVWDRKRATLRGRQGAMRVAIMSGGTIPDRGSFAVFMLADKPIRVGELDEEMVFESRAGDIFVLGASSWRIEEITHDRVLVTAAPGQPGRLPFWRGDLSGRPAEFGQAIGALSRRLLVADREDAVLLLEREHALTSAAATTLHDYLAQQKQATGEVPSDSTIVVERFVDEVGDYRCCLLSPYGTRVHAPWAMAIERNFRERQGIDVESTWHNDGIVLRLPRTVPEPDLSLLFPDAEDARDLLVAQLGHSALFSARFRENAMRALLLPRQGPGRRTPLWAQRRRSARLLKAAARHPEFPILLETYRECLGDVFDLPALRGVLADIAQKKIRTLILESKKPSPFSASLLFAYAGNFVYDRDIPLAEQRARVLTLNHDELRKVLGEAELRQLLDPACVEELRSVLSGAKYRNLRHADGLCDALLAHGDLSRSELLALCEPGAPLDAWLSELVATERALPVNVAGEQRFIAIEDAARYRDALGTPIPIELPASLEQGPKQPLLELCARYARCHVPFTTADVAARFGLQGVVASEALGKLAREGRIEQGAFLPGGSDYEWCDPDVLRLLKRRSLAVLREQIQPVQQEQLARLLVYWQGLAKPRAGLDGLLDVIEQLSGVPLSVVDLESEVFGARVSDYRTGLLDELISSGEVIWRGLSSLGQKDGRVALYLTDDYPLLAPPSERVAGALADGLREQLRRHGAQFLGDLARGQGGFQQDLIKTLWQMVWAGEVTNDTFGPLRSLVRGGGERTGLRHRQFRSRRTALAGAGSDGRWSLLPEPESNSGLTASGRARWAEVLLARHAIVTREALSGELVSGGFAAVLPVLQALEERSRVRRGYFISGLSGQQFAAPTAGDALRRKADSESPPALLLAAQDPANPYGASLPWPEGNPRPQRASGCKVLVSEGRLLLFVNKDFSNLTSFLGPCPNEAQLSTIASTLCQRIEWGAPRIMLIECIDGVAARGTELGRALMQYGFRVAEKGALRKGAD